MNHATARPTCRLITDATQWPSLRELWMSLYAITPEVTPWQSWDYLSRWWQHLGAGRQLRIVLVERDKEPLLLLPLQISAVRTCGLKIRVLEPIGMPDDINRPRLGLGHQLEEFYLLAFKALWEMRTQWDGLRIDEKHRDDTEIEWLTRFMAIQGQRLNRVAFHPCPYLELRQSWPAFLAARSTRLAKNLRVARRRLEARGPVTVTDALGTQVRQAFATLVSIHERSWKQTQGVGLSQSQSHCRFHAEVAGAMADRGSARILTLWCGQTPVAATLAYLEGETYYSAQIAHDEAYADCSPGTLLEALEIEGLMHDGRYRLYDFLGGALNNKRRWTDTAHQTERVWVLRPSIAGVLFRAYFFALKPAIRWLRGLPSAMRDPGHSIESPD